MKVLLLAAMAILLSAGHAPAGECKEHIELLSAAKVAEEMSTTESWVVGSYKINLWEQPIGKGRGRVVGRLLPGSRAVILDRAGEDYLVKSFFDGSTGWINKIQVHRTLWQDDKTFTPCRPKR